MKYGNITLGQVEALVNKVGGDKAAAQILSGDLVSFLCSPEEMFFDHAGVLSPRYIQTPVSGYTRKWWYGTRGMNYYLSAAQSGLEILKRKFPNLTWLEASKLGEKLQKLWGNLTNDMRLVWALEGRLSLVCLPQIPVGMTDVEFLRTILPAGTKVYLSSRPGFHDLASGDLLQRLVSVVDSPHREFLDRLRRQPAVAFLFQDALRGFPQEACVEVTNTLPREFILGGAVDFLCSYYMYFSEDKNSFPTEGSCVLPAIGLDGSRAIINVLCSGLNLSAEKSFAPGITRTLLYTLD